MNIKYEFQLSPRHQSLPSSVPGAPTPSAVWVSWTAFGLSALPCLGLVSPAYQPPAPTSPPLTPLPGHLAHGATWVKHCYHHTSHTPEPAFYPGFSLSVGQKV